MAVRAFGILVDDAAEAFRIATENGATPARSPVVLTAPLPTPAEAAIDGQPAAAASSSLCISEIKLYGDCVLRFVSGGYEGAYLPGWQAVVGAPAVSYGLQRLDHAVGNVPHLMPQVEYMARCLGEWVVRIVGRGRGTVHSAQRA